MKQLSFDFDTYLNHLPTGKTYRIPWQLLWVRDKSWRMAFMRRRYKSQSTLLTMVQVLHHLDGR